MTGHGGKVTGKVVAEIPEEAGWCSLAELRQHCFTINKRNWSDPTKKFIR